MTFMLKPLPFKPEALEPMISGKTLDFHYEKHHRGYLNKLNELILPSYEGLPLEEVIIKSHKDNDTAIFNNAAQVYNHSFYWDSITPAYAEPSARMKSLIEKSFGSYEAFGKSFIQHGIGQFGSGWVWLIYKNSKLELMKTPNAENPLTKGYRPVMTCDVWEHAYYLDYQNRRPDYLDTFIKRLVNWAFVEKNIG